MTDKIPIADGTQVKNANFSRGVKQMLGRLDWWNAAVLICGVSAVVFTGLVVFSQFVVVKLQKREAADAARALERYKLDAGQKIAEAQEEAAKANEHTEQLRADNLSLQASIRPRRLSFIGWTTHPGKVAAVYDGLKKYSGTVALIQVVPDFEAQLFASDIASVLAQAGWKPRIVNEAESHMPEMSFTEGVMIFTLSDGKTVTQAGTALWTAMVDAAHEMGGEPFESAPIHEILNELKPGYPHFEPPITAVFVRVGMRQVSKQFFDIQRRELERQNQELERQMRQTWKSGGKVMVQVSPTGECVEMMPGPDGKWVPVDPTKKASLPDNTPTFIWPGGMLRSKPPSEPAK